MSESIILMDRRIHSLSEWQRAIADDGFPLTFAPTTDLKTSFSLKGMLLGERIGLEGSIEAASSLIYPGRRWQLALKLRSGQSFASSMAAAIASLSYAQASAGVMYCGEDAEPSSDFAHVRQCIKAVIESRANIHRTGPAHLEGQTVKATITRF